MTTNNREKGVEEQTREDMTEIDIMVDRQKHGEGIAAIAQIKQIATKEELRLQEISNRYLGGIPYERERVLCEIKVFMHQTAEGIIEAGKRFIAMKEAEKHGEWENLVRERLGMSPPTAWRFMAIARKFPPPPYTLSEGAGKF